MQVQGGKYTGVYHFDSKAAVVEYISEKYPEVARKMSLLQMGLFITNWKWGQAAVPWEKRPDGSMLLKVPGSGNVPIPLVVPTDAGKFVKALTKLWSKITGVPAAFEHSTVETMDKLAPGGYGEEIGEMYAYAQDFGYWAKDDTSVAFAKDLGVDIPVSSIEEYIKGEDWSELLSRPVPT